MIDLDNLVMDEAEATVYWKTESAKVKYRPNVITIERIEKFEHGGGVTEEDLGDMLNFLCELLVSWDVVKGGEPVPITQAGLKALPMPLLQAVLTTILGDIQSGEAESSSVNGSRPRGSLAPVRSGTHSTEPQSDTESDLGSFSAVP